MSAEIKEHFFDIRQDQGMAVTYDDVTIMTEASDYDPDEVSTESYFTANVPLKVPFVSAAMDSVTGAEMAIAMAKFGGIGVINYGLSPKEQKREVRRVKLALNGMVETPVSFSQDMSLEKILRKCDKKGWDFRSFPIVDNAGKLVGMLTSKDFIFSTDMAEPASAAMTPRDELMVADPDTSIKEAYKRMQKEKKSTLPLVDSEGRVVGMYVYSDVDRIQRGNPNRYNLDDDNRLRVAAAVPTTEQGLRRIGLMRRYVDVVVIDTSTGDNKHARNYLREIKVSFPELDVMVGNISNPKSVKLLADLGADGIKVGQGPGSICTTRRELGYGVPQVTAIYGCAQAARQLNRHVPICGDGGVVFRGDISKAIAARADSVMMGSMLAGTDETPIKPIVLDNGETVVPYRGMGSEGAMRDSAAAKARYDAKYGNSESRRLPVPQGVEAVVAYKGSVIGILRDALEQLRKSMSGANAGTIKQHQDNTEFWQTTTAGIREAHPHDVMITK